MAETRTSDRLMQALRDQGDVPALVRRAQELQAAGELDSDGAQWLLAQARDWHAQGNLEQQRDACAIVFAVLPDHFEVLHLMGYGMQVRGEFARAEEYYARALAAKPDYAFAALALSQLRMMRTRFAEGRDGYEARFEAVTEGSGPDWRGLPIARWHGEPLEGKKLYLWAEQGLGDIVMFAGFLPMILEQRPARVALGMFPKLMSLFARSFPDIDVEPIDDAVYHALGSSAKQVFPHIGKLSQFTSASIPLEPLQGAYDYVQRHGLFDRSAPMGDLMTHFMPHLSPAKHVPWLAADPARRIAAHMRLNAAGVGRRIGISWRTGNRRELLRNIALEEWLPLLRIAGCHFVSLQHQVSEEEIRAFCAKHGCRITIDKETDLLADAEGLAALIAAMDEVVTIDNSNVHLAGALGVRATLLLPVGCNYRWPELEGGGTLWYKTVTTLRQQKLYDWREVMAAAAQRLLRY